MNRVKCHCHNEVFSSPPFLLLSLEGVSKICSAPLFAFAPKLSPTQKLSVIQRRQSASLNAPNIIVANYNHFALKMSLESLKQYVTALRAIKKHCCGSKSVTAVPVGAASEASVEWAGDSFVVIYI